MDRTLTYAEAIREATDQEMTRDGSVIVMGLGVDDPKGIYETTLGLAEKFGISLDIKCTFDGDF